MDNLSSLQIILGNAKKNSTENSTLATHAIALFAKKRWEGKLIFYTHTVHFYIKQLQTHSTSYFGTALLFGEFIYFIVLFNHFSNIYQNTILIPFAYKIILPTETKKN